MGYKETLNLPRTEFPMKANLPRREPEILKRWERDGVYARIREKGAKSGKRFILHDGPPYSNGSIHMGHVLNKILKDMVVKSRTMMGFDTPFVPGWDCHGLPVEHQLFKELGVKKEDVDQVDFRKKARDYAVKYVAVQRDEFKRLGIFGEWEKPYLTLQQSYEAGIIEAFGRLVEKGYIYKGLKPVNWCAACETALAEAEVEYGPHTSPSIFVKFEARELKAGDLPAAAKGAGKKAKPVSFVIWTTTPWTLIANAAIALHPDLDYVGLRAGDGEILIVAKDLKAPFISRLGKREDDFVTAWTVSGRDLEHSVCGHPFIDRESKVVLADYVSREEGTGCVHTAPGHGQEDYLTGKRYGLPVIMPVSGKGAFDKSAGEFAGIHVRKADPLIIEKLGRMGSLIASGKAEHSYPHCWRCGEPVIFRATEQYFMNVDHDGFRVMLGAAIEKEITWIPGAGRERIAAMVANRPDWCLSRQRYWGVPIIAFCCAACGRPVIDGGVIQRVSRIFAKEGSDVWFKWPENELLPDGFSCPDCGSGKFMKETDIIDVWFESGVSHHTVLRPRGEYPADLYLEGSDQHRGWFQSSLITSVAMNGIPPYKAVLTHGFVVDGNGRKMSKSLGNVVTPGDLMSKYGVDIMRMWVASCDYTDDIRISDQIVSRLADAYRKIRNTFRFILANLGDFDPDRDALPVEKWCAIDRWAVDRARALLTHAGSQYRDYKFHKVFTALYNFCVVEMSSIYMDVQKDTLYTEAAASGRRRSAQSALYDILIVLVHAAAPILSFTADEVWQHMPRRKGSAAGVHLSDWPDESVLAGGLESHFGRDAQRLWGERLLPLRGAVLKALEDKRAGGAIRGSLEANVALFSADPAWQDVLKEQADGLSRLFIVSKVEISGEMPGDGCKAEEVPVHIAVRKAAGSKCERCWNYSDTVGSRDGYPSLCERCADIVERGARIR